MKFTEDPVSCSPRPPKDKKQDGGKKTQEKSKYERAKEEFYKQSGGKT